MDNIGSPLNPDPAPVPPSLPPAQAPTAPPPLIASSLPSGAVAAKKSRKWMILAIVLSCVVVGIVLVNVGVLFLGELPQGSAYHTAGPDLVEVIVEEKDSADKIAIVKVEGLISGESFDGMDFDMPRLIKEQLKRAKKDKRVKAVILKIESPGGEVLASDRIYEEIAKFQAETGKPVIASMGSLAASGGYYVAAPCRWIVAHELTITGSIGVIMHGFNYRGLLNKVGVRPEVFKSGKFKDMLSGGRDLEAMTAEEKELYTQERKMVQDLIDETFNRFKTVVKTGRDQAAKSNRAQNLAKQWNEYADGRILSGRQAKELGFVDELGDFEMAVKRAERIAGVKEATLISYAVPMDLFNIFRLFAKSEPPAIKVDLGVNPALPIKSGRLYFLSPVLAD